VDNNNRFRKRGLDKSKEDERKEGKYVDWVGGKEERNLRRRRRKRERKVKNRKERERVG
jgi:hypothetical protein